MSDQFDARPQRPLPDNDFISAENKEINTASLLEKVRSRIQARRKELGYDNIIFPEYGGVTYPEKPTDIPYDPNLYYHLELVSESYTDVDTQLLLAESPSTRIPIIGNIWKKVRRPVHELVVFYVNRAVAHEVETNQQLITCLNLLTIENQKQQRQIYQLKNDIRALRSHIDD